MTTGKRAERTERDNLLLCDWSSQLFDLRALSSTDVPVLLLNQHLISSIKYIFFLCTLNPFISLKDGAIVFVLCDRSRVRCKQISLVNVRTSTEGFSSQAATSSFLQNKEIKFNGQMFVWDTQSFFYKNFSSDQ